MNPIAAAFARGKQFVPFLPAGDPDLAFTQDALRSLAAAGAGIIEVGFPFSDPIADGPVIQASYTRALAKGITLDALFAAVKVVATAPGWTTPLVAMASISLIHRYGPARFVATALDAGFAGAVVPDVPAEEAEELAKLFAEKSFALTLLVTPTTAPERAKLIVERCTGFVYVVSVVGITGERSTLPPDLTSYLNRLRALTSKPLCIGFGVSKPEHVQQLRPIADGVIVGTALVRHLAAAGQNRTEALAEFSRHAKSLAAALAE
jgi:tryptophan synthase alpha chain